MNSVGLTPVVDDLFPKNGSSLGNTTVTLYGQFNGLAYTGSIAFASYFRGYGLDFLMLDLQLCHRL